MFELWGKKIIIAGDRPGAAQAMKLANNMLYAIALVATSEAMTMSGNAGIPADAMLQVLNNGTGRNFAMMHLVLEAVFPRTFHLAQPSRIIMKDVDLAIAQGEELGVPMWVCQAVRLRGARSKIYRASFRSSRTGRATSDLPKNVLRDQSKQDNRNDLSMLSVNDTAIQKITARLVPQ